MFQISRKTIVLFFLILFTTIVNANNLFNEFNQIDSLSKLGQIVLNGNTDSEKFEANEKFKDLLIFILSQKDADKTDFSKVRNLSVQEPPDRKFRIFTWVVPTSNGKHEFFGVFHSYNKNRKRYNIIELNDVKNDIEAIEIKVLRKNDWYGALYYEIIPVKSNRRQFYTLLGWDGNDNFSNKKIIDVLSINSSGHPSFGANIFAGTFRHNRRIIFEYSNNSTMLLRWDRQAYTIQKQKRQNRNRSSFRNSTFRAMRNTEADNTKTRRRSNFMIVFDRLVPLNPSLSGVHKFYVPEGNIVDGFLFVDNRWKYIPDIDARNEPAETTKHQLRTPRGSRIPKFNTN